MVFISPFDFRASEYDGEVRLGRVLREGVDHGFSVEDMSSIEFLFYHLESRSVLVVIGVFRVFFGWKRFRCGP